VTQPTKEQQLRQSVICYRALLVERAPGAKLTLCQVPTWKAHKYTLRFEDGAWAGTWTGTAGRLLDILNALVVGLRAGSLKEEEK